MKIYIIFSKKFLMFLRTPNMARFSLLRIVFKNKSSHYERFSRFWKNLTLQIENKIILNFCLLIIVKFIRVSYNKSFTMR